MQKFDASIHVQNKALTRLLTAHYSEAITEFDFKRVSEVNASLAKAWQALHKALTGETAPEDLILFAVDTEQHTFKRFFGPLICREKIGNGVILSIGSKEIPLVFSKGSAIVKNLPSGAELESSIIELESGSGYSDLVMKFSLLLPGDKNDTLLVFNVPFLLQLKESANGKKVAPGLDTMQAAHKRGKLAKFLATKPSGFNVWTTYSLKALRRGDYKINSVRGPIGKDKNYILNVSPLNDDSPAVFDYGGEEQPFEDSINVWANAYLRGVLAESPEINEDHPAELIVLNKRMTKQGRISVDVNLSIDYPASSAKTEAKDLPDFDF